MEAFDTDRRVVAVTFDGGASDSAVADILDTLADDDVPATFFVTGAFVRAHPDSVRAMARAGHPVGNHSDTHPSFPESTNEEIRAEPVAAERPISAVTGETTKQPFRFPFWARTPLDIEVVNVAGYVPRPADGRPRGWKGTTEGMTAAAVRQRVIDTLRPGQVVLMHVGAHPGTARRWTPTRCRGSSTTGGRGDTGFATVLELLAEGRGSS